MNALDGSKEAIKEKIERLKTIGLKHDEYIFGFGGLKWRGGAPRYFHFGYACFGLSVINPPRILAVHCPFTLIATDANAHDSRN